ncbi:hypothetical protein [Streptomyces harbinensis]|uniref:Uncharacterized protein n=1 Tax=Streptomyces harbinensis TaxID=1176198 RepID=A0A1I6PMI6_9ACTN|nr:hypothetical protein [Streptomyces harbinensis]SFS41396.1 hypothetical protein SAMN05444716_101607 [Streptomyces harbinensis]
MAEVLKVTNPPVTASSRPCASVSPDKGNAPTITPARTRAELPPVTVTSQETPA